TYESAEALQRVLDMGVVEGATSAINQIDDLVAS
ncbi:MAG: SRPBCC domain-containing protein, partial [Actinomycetota bacterium]|nr:SRPBCC domain-containing protein [Actinomycetota bacterium]